MNRFFPDLNTLNQFTASLDHNIAACKHCHSVGQFVSHGFCYRQQSSQEQIIKGKRILCSSRGHRDGCGRTFQLYLSSHLPRLHYACDTLLLFILALLDQRSIAYAYCHATLQSDSRNAYRWLQRLQRHLPLYRSTLLQSHAPQSSEHKQPFPLRRRCLFSSLHDLYRCLLAPMCHCFQLKTQHSFI
jgi:hypothetical protein